MAPLILNDGITPVQQAISASSGALITALFVNPLDVIKIRMQTQLKQNCVHSKQQQLSGHRFSCPSYDPNRNNVVPKRCVTPLDVVKVRLQAQQRPLVAGRCFIYCNGLMDHICVCEPFHNGPSTSSKNFNWYSRPGRFSGTLDAFIKITRSEGLSSLWSGLPPTLIMAVPATVVYFTFYDNLMSRLKRRYSYSTWMPVLAGGCARTACVTLISPLEMIRTKLQSEKLKYSEMLKAVKIATAQRGLSALWTGLEASLLRDVPFSCLYWLFYETFKAQLMLYVADNRFLLSFTSGAVAGSLAAVATCPFDVVKTHQQVELGEKKVVKDFKSRPSSSTLRSLRKLYTEQGFRSLFAGLTPRVIKVAPACAIMIGTYEYLKGWFAEMNRRNRDG